MPDRSIRQHLARPDKWFLGGPGRLAWTPPHPQWLDWIGFWDEAHYYDFPLAPLFTITLLGDDGRAIPYRREERRWQPDRLLQRYSTRDDLALTEKAHLPGDVLASALTVENTGDEPHSLHLVAWTMQEASADDDAPTLNEIGYGDERIRFERRLARDERRRDVACALGADRAVESHSITLSETGPMQPRWSYTPFYESFADGRLDDARHTGGTRPNGKLYAALQLSFDLPPGEARTATVGMAVAPDAPSANRALDAALPVGDDGDALQMSTSGWSDYFEDLPQFSCSDPHLDTYYWYRWYGLRLFAAEPDDATNYRYSAVYEGLGYFRKLITYSAQCHMLETRWMNDPARAQGSLLNHVENQRDDGGFTGHLFSDDAQENSFYHANWGHLWDVHRNHPDDEFLRKAYDGLQEYLAYFDRERDPDDSGLYDIHNHYETGQEYMHRYVAVSADADKVHWGQIFRLKGVDAAVQIYQTKRAMAKTARRLGRDDEAASWDESADATRRAVREHMWDPDQEMFFDLDPETGERTGVKATTCFYPYFTDIVTEKHLPGLKKHLLSEDEFWTPYPAASSSRDDPYFSAEPLWKEKRMNCPWNGRVWPMTNSHVAEALAQAAIRFEDEELRAKAATFMHRYVRMLFDAGDPERPNCFEHYNPMTGQPCRYRGVDDYQHSWIVELIVKYVCGIRPGDDSVTVDPFPFDVERVRIDDVPVRGHSVGVEREGDRFRAFIGGEAAGEGALGEALRLDV
jgi:hypothetical protein